MARQLYRHRLKKGLTDAVNQGKNSFFLYGEGISDIFLESFYKGTMDLKDTIKRFFFRQEDLHCDKFVYVSNTITIYQPGEVIDEDITTAYLEENRKEDVSDEKDLFSERKKALTDDDLNTIMNNRTAFYNYLTEVKCRIENPLPDDQNTVVFFENMEWIASLYVSPDADSIKYIRLLKELIVLDHCYVVVSVADMDLLKNFNFEKKGSNVIYVGNPSAGEIKYTYLRHFLKKSALIQHPSLDMFRELDHIAQAVAMSEKSLREAVNVLDKLVIEKKKHKLQQSDFEIAIKRITEEKVYLKDVILDEKIKQEIVEMIDSFINSEDSSEYKKGLLLTGPPGTGKTELVKALANEKNCHFMAPKLSDLKGEYVGQSSGKIKRIFDEARANAPTIMFIDEADTVFPKRDGGTNSGDSYTNDMVNQFLQEIEGISTGKEGEKVFVIAATNRAAIIDSAIQSRLSRRIHIGLPDKESRIEIFDSKLKKYDYSLSDKNYCNEFIEKTVNMSGRDITNYVKDLKIAVRNSRKKIKDLKDDENSKKLLFEVLQNNEKKLIEDLQNEVPVTVLSPEEINISFDDIIGYDEVKRQIKKQSQYILADEEKREAARNFGIHPNKGILMYGPPGNAKTMFAEAAAKESGFDYVKVVSKDFTSDSISKQLDNLQKIFDKAVLLSKMSKNGVVLFFDEIDSLAGRGMSSTVRGSLLTYLAEGEKKTGEKGSGIRSEDSKVLLMAATNNYSALDEATIRKGRIDVHIFMDNPSEEEGVEMLKQCIDKASNKIEVDDTGLAKVMYDSLKNKISSQKGESHLRPSGSELINMYEDLKGEAFFEQWCDNMQDNPIEIDESLVENYFGEYYLKTEKR